MIAGEIGTRPWYQSGEPCEQIQGVEQKVGSTVAIWMLQGVDDEKLEPLRGPDFDEFIDAVRDNASFLEAD